MAGAACGPALRENPRAGQRAYRTGTFLVPAFAIHEAPGWLPSEIARRLDVRCCTARTVGPFRGHIFSEHTSDPARSWEALTMALEGGGTGPRGLSGPPPCPPPEPDNGWIASGGPDADAPQVSATAPLGASERIRVLVVDDNDGFRESLVFLLSGRTSK